MMRSTCQPSSIARNHRAGLVLRVLSTLPLLLGLALALLMALGLPSARAAGPQVDVVPFHRDVDPAAVRYVSDALAAAQGDGATAIVLEIDTPGGDTDSMQQIVQKELASRIPIISYVTPSGAHAGSAGAFLALAAPVAAMAPDTRIGASSPIDATGQNLESTLDRKIKNDLEALIRSLQTGYHRNPGPAVDMVETARSLNETDALQQEVVNFVAPSREELLSRLDGTTVTLSDGTAITLRTAGLPVHVVEESFLDQVRGVLYNPTIDFILFIVAALCIYLELAHPGAIVPGTVGGIAFLVFLYGAQALNPNWAGLALMVLAILLLAVDVRAPTHGVLTVGALISLVVGALIFFDTGGAPGAQGVSPVIIAAAALALGLCSAAVITYAVRIAHRTSRLGSVQELIGQTARVIEPLAPTGRVRVVGENWAARAPAEGGPIGIDARVRVKAIEGLTLIVEPEPPK